MKKKKVYEQPQSAVTRVELESPICSGSVRFVGEGKPEVNIREQEVISSDVNDFSDNSWGVLPGNTPTE